MREDLVPENIDTLQKFGPSFQTKTLAVLLTDMPFLEQTHDIITPQYFENESNRWIAEKILWCFQEYRIAPTPEIFKQEIDKIAKDNTLSVSIVEQLKNVYKHTKSPDAQYIKDEFIQFCKNQAIKNAVLRSATMLERGQYDQIKVLVDRALNAGLERNIGHIWNTDIEQRVAVESRNTIATPWPLINQLMDGGIGPAELGCIVAPAGIGKSWVLSTIGNAAIKAGYRVAHYTFELSQNYVGLRYDSIATGLEPTRIKHHVAKVKEEIDKINGELIVKFYPTRSITVKHIDAHIKRMTQLGYKPDLVIVDYADLMRSIEKANTKWDELGYIYEELRGLFGEMNIGGWTASQSQRSSLQDDIVEADKIAGAYSKIMTCDFVMSISRKLHDKVHNTARVHVMKNRFGADGLTFPSYMDLSRGKIEIFDENSREGQQIKEMMANGHTAVKSMMQKKLRDFNEKLPDHITDEQDAMW